MAPRPSMTRGLNMIHLLKAPLTSVCPYDANPFRVTMERRREVVDQMVWSDHVVRHHLS